MLFPKAPVPTETRLYCLPTSPASALDCMPTPGTNQRHTQITRSRSPSDCPQCWQPQYPAALSQGCSHCSGICVISSSQ